MDVKIFHQSETVEWTRLCDGTDVLMVMVDGEWKFHICPDVITDTGSTAYTLSPEMRSILKRKMTDLESPPKEPVRISR